MAEKRLQNIDNSNLSNFLLSEELAGTKKINSLFDGRTIDVRKGAKYQILDPDSLLPVDLLLGSRVGNDLMVTLSDGTMILLRGYFSSTVSFDGKETVRSNAYFENDISFESEMVDQEASGSESDFYKPLTVITGGVLALALFARLGASESRDSISINNNLESSSLRSENEQNSQNSGFYIQSGSEFNVKENTSGVLLQPTLSLPETQVNWSLLGRDADKFSIDRTTGEITFSAFDFESFSESGKTPIFDITLVADGPDGLRAEKAISVNIIDVIEQSNLEINIATVDQVDEGDPYQSLEPTVNGNIGDVVWSLGGEDSALFSINRQTGVISLSGRDFEKPTDRNKDNRYQVSLIATDSDGNKASEMLSIQVDDVEEKSDIRISGIFRQTVSQGEDLQLSAPYATGAVGKLTWSLSGDDVDDFELDSTNGVVLFRAKNFDLPSDADSNNIYTAFLTATDSDNNSASQLISVTVSDRQAAPIVLPPSNNQNPGNDENPLFEIKGLSNAKVKEHTLFSSVEPFVSNYSADLTWALFGEDADFFLINEDTGIVSIRAANPGFDFENPQDTNRDNVYELVLRVEDNENGLAATIPYSIEVIDDRYEIVIDDNVPTFTPFPDFVAIFENQIFTSKIPTLNLDPIAEGLIDPDTFAWSLSGDDASLFSIDSDSGVFEINNAPDYELPTDVDQDNTYEIVLTASSGGVGSEVIHASQAIKLLVGNVLESNNPRPPTNEFFIDNYLNLYEIEENVEFNSVVPVIHGNSGDIQWSLFGPDAEFFAFDPTNPGRIIAKDGIRFNYENPLDTNRDNTYQFYLIAEDSATGKQLRNDTAVIIKDFNEEIFTEERVFFPEDYYVSENTTFSLPEPKLNLSAYADITADPEWILDGADASHFTISSNGIISLKNGKDFETPYDFDKNNKYDFRLSAKQDDEILAQKNLSLYITDVDDQGIDDGVPASLLSVSSPAGSLIYGFGETLSIELSFDRPVQVTAGLQNYLTLSNGEKALYSSGSGSNVLTFEYTIQSDDKTPNVTVDSIYSSGIKGVSNGLIDTQSFQSFTSALGNGQVVEFDASPSIISIDILEGNGSFVLGDLLTLEVKFDQAVSLTGDLSLKPILALNNGAEAIYKSGSGSDTFIFEYIVGADELIAELDVTAIAENSTVIRNNASLPLYDSLSNIKFGNLSDNADIKIVDGVDLSILGIDTSNPDGTYIEGEVLSFSVNFDDNVFVTLNGVDIDSLDQEALEQSGPSLTMNSGGKAVYVSGSGSTELLFEYELGSGDFTSSLKPLALSRNSSEIRGEKGEDVLLAFDSESFIASHSISVDAIAPVIQSIENVESVREVVSINNLPVTHVSGLIKLFFSEPISIIGNDSKLFLSGIDDKDNRLYPEIGQFVSHDPETNSLVYSYDGYLRDEFIPLEATALIENSTQILDFSGNSAKTKISLGVNDIAGTLLAGAGEFVSDELGVRLYSQELELIYEDIFDPKEGALGFLDVLSSHLDTNVVVEIFDANGEQTDYLDEYTNELKSLSSESIPVFLRLAISANELAANTVNGISTSITPLTELAFQIARENADDSYRIDNSFLETNSKIASLFHLDSLTQSSPLFITDDGFSFKHELEDLSDPERYGLALAQLSKIDSTSGSIAHSVSQLKSLISFTGNGDLVIDNTGLLESLVDRSSEPLSGEPRVLDYIEEMSKKAFPVPTVSSTDSGFTSVSYEDAIVEIAAQILDSNASELSQKLATDLYQYTTALKIRASLSGAGDTDLSSDDYAALGLELGDDADRDLVNITLRQALAEGRQPSELKTLTETRLADFAALSQWANQSSVLSNVSVASEIDLSTQFMQLESKLNSVMPDGSAVSAMTSTLREQFALTNQEYVLVQLNELNDARAVQSFTLPDSIISLSEFGALSLQGLDSNQQWQPIESFNQDSLQSSGILQGINLDGFTALRLVGPANTPLSEREKIIGDSIELTLAGISEAPAKTDLLGVEVLTEYPLELVHRLVDTTSASDFQSYLKLAKTMPLLDAILEAQSERIGSMSAEDEQVYFTTLVKVCLSVEEKLSSGEMSHSFETLGQLDLAEFNALTGLTLETEEQLSEKLDVLATFYTNNQDLSFAISHFRDLSWENNDKLLLNESLESLNAKAVALAMESAQSDESVESLKKVTSAIKFKKLLTGTDEGEVTLNAEDFNHFGFEPIAGQDFAQIAQAISAAAKQGEVTERKLVEFVNTINITDSESDAILEALLSEDEYGFVDLSYYQHDENWLLALDEQDEIKLEKNQTLNLDPIPVIQSNWLHYLESMDTRSDVAEQ